LTSQDETTLLRALATLQSGCFPELTLEGDVVVFKEEWERAFSAEVQALLDALYRKSHTVGTNTGK
jgi:hypothetical protein